MEILLAPINAFLHCKTPDAWLEQAARPENLPVLLIDHANCELKAAQTAVWLLRRYVTDPDSSERLLTWLQPYEDYVYRGRGDGIEAQRAVAPSKKLLSQSGFEHGDDMIDRFVLLIKEELHHFHQVLELLHERRIAYQPVNAARYAKGLMQHVRTYEPATLVDKLICGAYIEARSCERFAALAPLVDKELSQFYVSLLRSEARHFKDYLTMAEKIAGSDISERVQFFGEKEANLITSEDDDFKFHSGVPTSRTQ